MFLGHLWALFLKTTYLTTYGSLQKFDMFYNVHSVFSKGQGIMLGQCNYGDGGTNVMMEIHDGG